MNRITQYGKFFINHTQICKNDNYFVIIKWVWHFDTLTPHSTHNRFKLKSIQLFLGYYNSKMSLTTLTTIIWICFLSRESSLEAKTGFTTCSLDKFEPFPEDWRFTRQTRIRNLSPWSHLPRPSYLIPERIWVITFYNCC